MVRKLIYTYIYAYIHVYIYIYIHTRTHNFAASARDSAGKLIIPWAAGKFQGKLVCPRGVKRARSFNAVSASVVACRFFPSTAFCETFTRTARLDCVAPIVRPELQEDFLEREITICANFLEKVQQDFL